MVVADNEERAILGTAPTLKVLDIAYGKNSAAAWLLPHIHNLSTYCGVKDLHGEAAKELATIIVREFSYLKATEVMLFFYRFKAGRYGQFYGRVDPLVIMEALRNRFIPERNAIIEQEDKARERAERERRAACVATPEQIAEIKKRLQL